MDEVKHLFNGKSICAIKGNEKDGVIEFIKNMQQKVILQRID